MSQPIWKFLVNLGDDDINCGGRRVYVDETGVYPPEVEVLEPPTDDDFAAASRECQDACESDDSSDCEGCCGDDHCEHCPPGAKLKWSVQRYALERLKLVEGCLVSINYRPDYPHPLKSYVEWFASSLGRIAGAVGTTRQELVDALCSDDPRRLANAFEAIEGYHGLDNFDSYPSTYTRAEIVRRYSDDKRDAAKGGDAQ